MVNFPGYDFVPIYIDEMPSQDTVTEVLSKETRLDRFPDGLRNCGQVGIIKYVLYYLKLLGPVPATSTLIPFVARNPRFISSLIGNSLSESTVEEMVDGFVLLAKLRRITFDTGDCDTPAAPGAELEVGWNDHKIVICNPRIRLAEDYLAKMRLKSQIKSVSSRDTRMDSYPEPLSRCDGIKSIEHVLSQPVPSILNLCVSECKCISAISKSRLFLF